MTHNVTGTKCVIGQVQGTRRESYRSIWLSMRSVISLLSKPDNTSYAYMRSITQDEDKSGDIGDNPSCKRCHRMS